MKRALPPSTHKRLNSNRGRWLTEITQRPKSVQ